MANSQRGFLHALQQGTASVEVAGKRMQAQELAAVVGAIARSVSGARRVAITAHPTLDTLLAVAGVLLAGAAAVPINPAAGEVERRHILHDSAADLIFEGVDYKSRAPLPADLPADESPALVMYTSGSTGPPKGVVLPRRAIASNLDALQDAWEWTQEDVLAHALPFFHLHGLGFGGLGPLRHGSALVHTGVDFRPRRRRHALFRCPIVLGVADHRRHSSPAQRQTPRNRRRNVASACVRSDSGDQRSPAAEPLCDDRNTGHHIAPAHEATWRELGRYRATGC